MVTIEEIQAAYYMVAATGVLVAAVFYILNLRISQRNQELTLKTQEQSTKAQQQTLETRQGQMFMSIYDKTTTSEFMHQWSKVMTPKWKTYEDYQKLCADDLSFYNAANMLLAFYEGVGVLVREGLLPIRMVAMLMCGMTRYFWERHESVVVEGRRQMGFSRWFSETEYLYRELRRYLGEHPEFDTRIERSLI